MYKNLNEKIKFQISEVDILFKEYDLFLQSMNYNNPDLLQITVMASIIHSFYTCIEKTFKRISKDIDNFTPVGNKSHHEILKNVYSKNNKRLSVINEDTYVLLNEYMIFRHYFRISYSSQFNWNKIRPLASNLSNTWNILKGQLVLFENSLK